MNCRFFLNLLYIQRTGAVDGDQQATTVSDAQAAVSDGDQDTPVPLAFVSSKDLSTFVLGDSLLVVRSALP